MPEALFYGGPNAINTPSIVNAMGSTTCQQTFKTTAAGYLTIKIVGAGCPISAPGNYVIALRSASNAGLPTSYNYWAVGGGGEPADGGVWSYQTFHTWTNGVVSAPLTPPGIGSLQVVATL